MRFIIIPPTLSLIITDFWSDENKKILAKIR
nr:MAG TPA: hypothetical protein [Caudoviricetes sp.]